MTTAQAGLGMSDPEAYREKMFKLLGDRDPLAVLAQTASALADVVRNHSAMVLRARPFEGKWTPNEVIGHLADSGMIAPGLLGWVGYCGLCSYRSWGTHEVSSNHFFWS